MKTIVITGVTKGIGRALAGWFTAEGHTVVGCGRNEAKIRELKTEPGPAEHFVAVDVTDAKAVSEWAAKVIERHGPPDILVNNAAVITENAKLWEVSAAEFDQVIDVNLKGVANVLRAFVPSMVARNSGVIVNLSSGAGRFPIGGMATYCCSKWGIEGLTQSLAEDLPEGMAAVPLSPGTVNTEMLQTTFGASASQSVTPDEWARKGGPFILGLGPKDNGKPLEVRG